MAKPAKVIDLVTRRVRTEPFFSPSSYEILSLRTDLGFSQEAFARFLETSFATINRWERGRAKPHGLMLTFLRALQVAKKRDRKLGELLPAWTERGQGYMLHRVFSLACKPGQRRIR